jgi:prepilin signal peptidase PulO-like enzyme (type II secretory pathway)
MQPDTLLFAAPASLIPAIAAAIFGLLIGSFLNVVVHRLPIMRQREIDNYIADKDGKPLPHPDRYNLMVPRSACPHCGHQITALENIPIVSWLALRGKCSKCKAPISARYPIVEAVSGILSGLLVWHFGSGWVGLATLVFTYLLISMTLIDVDHKELPDDLTYPLLWLGLLINLDGSFVPLRDAVLGAAAGYMFLWIVARAYEAGARADRHGRRRLQAAGRAGRLVRLADAADDHRAVVLRRRRHRCHHDADRQNQEGPAHPVRPLPGRRWYDRPLLRTGTDAPGDGLAQP